MEPMKITFLLLDMCIYKGRFSHIGKEIQSGEFGSNMKVSLTNDGPVTIIIDTKNKE